MAGKRHAMVKDEVELWSCLKMAEALARKFCRGGWRKRHEPDLTQEGRIAVLRSWERFDPLRGVRFSTFCHQQILRALWRYEQQHRETVELVSLDALVGADDGDRLEETILDDRVDVAGTALHRAEAGELATHVSALKGRQRLVIQRRYVDGWAFDQIGAELGISRQGASALHQVALKTLRGRLTVQQHGGSATQ